MKYRCKFLPVLLIVLLAAGSLVSSSQAQNLDESTFESMELPAFSLLDLDGNEVDSESY